MKVAPEKDTSRKYERLIAALLETPTIKEAARAIHVGETTVFRWMKDSDFQEQYRQVKKQTVELAIARLQKASGEAVKTLESVMKGAGNPPSSKVAAAKIILEMALKGVELEDLERRIVDLEKYVREKK